MFETLDHLDRNITLAINSLHFKAGDQLWQLCSDVKIWIPLYLTIIIFLFVRLGWKRALVVLISVALTAGACDQFANIIKHGVERLRPCYDLDMLSRGLHVLEGRGKFFGFFSAHAANAFGIATSSVLGFKHDKSHRYKTYGWLIYVWAFMVSISRVFAGKHYFGDITVGMLVGLCFGFVFAYCAKLIINKVLPSPSGCPSNP